MESKVCIFALLVISAHSGFAVRQDPYELSKQESAIFKDILSEQDKVTALKDYSLEPVFDFLQALSIALIPGQTSETSDASSKIEDGTNAGKQSVARLLHVLSLATGKSCSALKTATAETDAEIDAALAAANEAVVLASSGNYPENKAKIEELEASEKQHLDNMLNAVFDAYRTCLASTNEDTLTTIATVQRNAVDSLRRVGTALFNAIKSYEIAATDGTACVSLLQAIEDSRNDALRAFRQEVANIFSLVRAIFQKEHLTELHLSLSTFQSIQLDQILLTNNYKSAAHRIIDAVEHHVKKVLNGVSDEVVHSKFSPIDVVKAATTSDYQANVDLYLEAALRNDHDGILSPVAEKGQEYLTEAATGMSNDFHSAIATTQEKTSLSEVRTKIATFKATESAGLITFPNSIFELISDGQTFSKADQAVIEKALSSLITELEAYLNVIFGEIDQLAEVSFTTEKVNEHNFTTLKTSRKVLDVIVEKFIQEVAKILLIVAHSQHE